MKIVIMICLILCLAVPAPADQPVQLEGLSLQELEALRRAADERIRSLTLTAFDGYTPIGDGESLLRRPQEHMDERISLTGRLFVIRPKHEQAEYIVSLEDHPQRVFLLRYAPRAEEEALLPGDLVSVRGIFRGLAPYDEADPLGSGAGLVDAELIVRISAPPASQAAYPYAGTREDPAPLGVSAFYEGSYWSGYAGFEIRMLSMTRGNAALKAAQKMSKYNITPPRTQEWFIVTLWVKALSAPGDRAEIKSEDFRFVSRGGTEYPHHFLINDIHGLRALYTGAEQTANIACLIDKGDEPLIVYQPESLTPLWFDPGRQPGGTEGT